MGRQFVGVGWIQRLSAVSEILGSESVLSVGHMADEGGKMIGTQVMTASVSVIEMFRQFPRTYKVAGGDEVEETWEEWQEKLLLPASPQMEAGKAFHSALEHVDVGEVPTLESDGYLFDFSQFNGELALGQVGEIPVSQKYGDLLVRGRCDDVTGSTVTDYKLTFSSFDAERYLESFQWRFYLDMLKANRFVYQVFEGYQRRGAESDIVDIKKLHTLRLYRYPEMEADCQKLAKRFHEIALRHPSIAKIRDEADL